MAKMPNLAAIRDWCNERFAKKTDLPKKLSDLENDDGFVKITVDNLINYYKKNDTYNKEEIASLIAGIKTTEFKVVDALPANDISTSTIYLVPKGNLADGNIYSEYIYVGDKWELIGDTAVDLDGYVTEEQIDTKLEDYAKKSEIAEGLQEITAEEALAILNKE